MSSNEQDGLPEQQKPLPEESRDEEITPSIVKRYLDLADKALGPEKTEELDVPVDPGDPSSNQTSAA